MLEPESKDAPVCEESHNKCIKAAEHLSEALSMCGDENLKELGSVLMDTFSHYISKVNAENDKLQQVNR